MFFNRPQRIRSLDRSMLARVAGENETPAIFADHFQKQVHLFPADLPGLVHDDDRALQH